MQADRALGPASNLLAAAPGDDAALKRSAQRACCARAVRLLSRVSVTFARCSHIDYEVWDFADKFDISPAQAKRLISATGMIAACWNGKPKSSKANDDRDREQGAIH
jgi:hypothetical protein